MRILIDFLAPIAGGGVTYIRNLLAELNDIDKKNQYYVFIRKSLFNKIQFSFFDNIKFLPVDISVKNTFFRFIYEQIFLPYYIYIKKIDVLYSAADITSFFAPCNVILMVRNLNPYYIDTTKKPILTNIKFILEKFLTKLSTIKAKKVIFVSEWAEKVISKQLRISSSKIKVIYHGIKYKEFSDIQEKETDKKIQQTNNKYKDIILLVSTINPHKNFEVVFKAYKKLSKEIRDNFLIMIAGRIATYSYYKNLKLIIEKLNIEKKVKFLGEVNYKEIPYLYKNSQMFIQPSLLESFGHTVVEAMAAGIPVIAADRTATPEVLGNAGLLFDPSDPEELAEKIQLVLNNRDLQDRLIRKGKERVKQFSWEKTAIETLKVFENVAKGK